MKQKFVALLRGINIGGHKKVPMKELKKVLEKEGFQNVKTLLASGNVVFECDPEKAGQIQDVMEAAFGFSIHTIVLPFEVIAEMVDRQPFQNVKVTPETRLYVTFTGGKKPKTLKIPYQSENASFQILSQTAEAVFGVLNLEKIGSIEVMNILEKEFGKEITTRNFNTIKKIARL